jgi:hypothetical protein
VSSASLTALIGMLSLNLIIRLIHYFNPIDGNVSMIITIFIFISILINRKQLISYYHTFSRTPIIILSLILLTILFCSLNIALRPCAFDTGSYHLQAVQWNEKYAIVPGLANLIRQLGFNSNWYLLQAFSGFSFLGLKSIYTLNSLLLLLFIAYLSPCLTAISSKRYSRLDLYRMLALLSCLVLGFGKYAGEVTADFPIIILISWLILLILESGLKDVEIENMPTLLVFLIPVYLITIKISSVPLLIIAMFVWWKAMPKHKLILICLCFLMITPWLVGNVVLSGYLVFPFKAIDLFSLDWKVPDQLIIDENNSIKGWARAPYHDVMKAGNMDFEEWFPIWLQTQKFYNWLFVIFIFPLLFFSQREIKRLFTSVKIKILVLTIIAGICFWFINAPDFRFVYGYLIPVFCALGSLSIKKFSLLQRTRISLIPTFLLISPILGVVNLLKANQNEFADIILLPLPYQISADKFVQINSDRILTPTWEQKCWDMPIPCTCEYYEGLELRGGDLQQGFRIKLYPTK